MRRSISPILSLFFLAGCLALESVEEGGSQCAGGQVFDPVHRTCQGAVIPEGAPSLNLQGVSINEDSGRTRVRLSYFDYENDPALGCQATSREDGFVREKSSKGCTSGPAPTILTLPTSP